MDAINSSVENEKILNSLLGFCTGDSATVRSYDWRQFAYIVTALYNIVLPNQTNDIKGIDTFNSLLEEIKTSGEDKGRFKSMNATIKREYKNVIFDTDDHKGSTTVSLTIITITF